MIPIWIDLHIKLFVGLYQRFSKNHSVLNMHVVVATSMANQKLAFQ